MIRYLLIKALRDILQMWPQFVSVFIMSFIAISIQTGMEGVWYGLSGVVDSYYSETNLADAWVYGKNVSNDQMYAIRAIQGVRAATASMSVLSTMTTDGEEQPDVKLIALDDESLFTPHIVIGEIFEPRSQDDIWLDQSFATSRRLAVGDELELQFMGQEKIFLIKGLILHSEFIYYTGSIARIVPDYAQHGYGVISEDAAKSFLGIVYYNELRLSLTKGTDVDIIESSVKDILGDSFYQFVVREDMVSASQIATEISRLQIIAYMFSAVFFLLILLTMYTTMSRVVNTQIIQIGTMKAIGIGNNYIRLHYVTFGLVVSSLGCLLGSIFGPAYISKPVMDIEKTILILPDWSIALSPLTYGLVVSIVLICAVGTLFAVRYVLRNTPAETMRGEAPKGGQRLFLERFTALWRRLSFEWKWTLRDVSRNKVRWFMGVVGVAGSMTLMIAGLGFKDSIDFTNAYVFSTQYRYKYKAVLNNYTREDLADFDDFIDCDIQYVQEGTAELFSGGKKVTKVFFVLDEGELFGFYNLDDVHIELPENGVLINKKLANSLNIVEGDTVQIRIVGQPDPADFFVSGITKSPSPQGVFMSRGYWENLDYDFSPTSILIDETERFDEIKELDYVKEFIHIDKQVSDMNRIVESVMTIMYLLIAASVLLSVVILYNLGMLSFIERSRVYATMKVLGFRQKEIRSLALRDCLLTTLIGWGAGVPIGFQFLDIFIRAVQLNSFEWFPTLLTKNFVFASVGIISCSIGVSLLLSYRVRGINMVEALKSVE